MRCPNSLDLQSYFDRELSPGKTKRLAHHLLSCQSCRERLAALNELTQTLQKGYPELREVVLPQRSATRINLKRSLAAAAVAVVLLGFSTAWYVKTFNPLADRQQAVRATELLEQYFILYQEATESVGGSDV